MTHSLDDVLSYEKKALSLIPMDHPFYEQVRQELIDQVNDEIEDYANTLRN